MNKLNRLARFMPWLTALLLSALVAGCGGGGSDGREPVLGVGATGSAAAKPTVSSTTPINASGANCPTAPITATFTVPSGLRMDPATLNATTFIVTGPGPTFTPVVATTIALDAATGLVATFTPNAALTTGTTYTVTIKGGAAGVKDLAVPGNAMVADFVFSFTAGAAGSCVTPVALASAATYGGFGGSAGITNQGLLTRVNNGDIGTTAASTLITGFHDPGPGCTYTETPLNSGLVSGKINTAAPPPTVACPSEGTAATFALAQAARNDALIAYNALVAKAGGPDPGAGNLANLVLTPGTYTALSGSFMIQGGNLTLDAQGNPNAVFVFQMATTLTVGGPGAAAPQSVILVGGAQAQNVYWQVGSAATINGAGGGTFVGTVITNSGAITVSTPGNATVTTINGRLLSLNAGVTVVNTVINVP